VNSPAELRETAARAKPAPTLIALPRRKKNFLTLLPLLLPALLAVLLWMPRLRGPIDLRYDAGVYYLLGVSLAQGDGYRILSEPGAPEGIQYPPLLPAFVALHAKVFQTTDPLELGRWLRRSYFAMFVAFAVALGALARTFLDPPWAAFAACLCLLQFNTYLLSDLLFAELPFSLTSVAFVWTLTTSWKSDARQELSAFTCASAGFLLRSAGLALLAAWVGEALLRGRWRQAALRAALSLVPFGLWQAHVTRVQASAEYQAPAYAYQRAPYQFYNVTYATNIALVDPFQPELGLIDGPAVVRRIAANIAVIPTAVGEAISANYGFWRWALNELQDRFVDTRPIPKGLVLVPLWSLAALGAVGLVVLVRRKSWAIPLVVAGSIGLVCLTPWPGQFSRYLSPLAGLLSIAVVIGARHIYHSRRARWRFVGAPLAILGGLLVAVQLFTVTQIYARHRTDPRMPAFGRAVGHPIFYHDQTWTAWERAVAWIAQHAPVDAVVATSAPHLCYLWTGRHSIFPPMEVDAAVARGLLEAVPVTHVIVDELAFLDISRRYAEPAVAEANSGWRKVYSDGGTHVYARERARP
jgi:hypothetical protein